MYSIPGLMTAVPERRVAGLPTDIAALAAVGHGLIVHEFMAETYGVTYTEADRATVHVRPVSRLVERILAVSPDPLVTTRPPGLRVAGNCRQFTVLMVAA